MKKRMGLMPKSLLRWIVLSTALTVPTVVFALAGPPIVTILEGSAIVFHGTSKLAATEGERVQPGDLVETSKDSFLRLEYEDGTHIDLGPKTQLQVAHPTETKGDRAALYVLTGWIKLTIGETKRAPNAAFASPLFDGTDIAGVVVAHIGSRGGAMFVETGRVRTANRHVRAPSAPTLTNGDFASIASDGRAVVDAHPSGEFLEQMPRPFRDSLPSRLNRFREHPTAAKSLGEFSYGDVEAWINAEPSVRRQFVQTWRTRADDPAFRLELTGKLALHPEWGPVLFPELYTPKPAATQPNTPPPASSPEGASAANPPPGTSSGAAAPDSPSPPR